MANQEPTAHARALAALQTYQSLKATNPHAAAAYFNSHDAQVSRGRELARVANATPTAQAPIVAEVAALSAQRQKVADLAAVAAHLEHQALKRSNPHAAAMMVLARGDEIFRGRELAQTQPETPEPPKSAA